MQVNSIIVNFHHEAQSYHLLIDMLIKGFLLFTFRLLCNEIGFPSNYTQEVEKIMMNIFTGNNSYTGNNFLS